MFSKLFFSVLLATTVLAGPRGNAGLSKRVAARAARRGGPRIPSQSAHIEAPEGSNASHVEFSSNWSGAILTSPPSGEKFTSVTGEFNVPTPSRPSGSSSGSFAASAWVGIDGDTAQNSILQSGIDFTISGKDSISYDAWFEWFPLDSEDFNGPTLAAGDTVKVTVTATSSTTGTVVLENLTTGKSVTTTVSAPDSGAALAQQNAEWIVEDFEEGDSLVNFADFNTITFTNAAATAGGTVTLSGATLIEIESSSGEILTDVSLPSDSSVVVSHT